MKSLTLHNLDDDLYIRIKTSAKKNRRSMNQEIKDKLINYYIPDSKEDSSVSFKKFLGIWNEKEHEEFMQNISDFDKISESDWD